MTHKILVSVKQDWEQGIVDAEAPAQVGIIELDIVNNRVLPLMVNLKKRKRLDGLRERWCGSASGTSLRVPTICFSY